MAPRLHAPLRLLYIHIPKTGGNSVNRAFGRGWENHQDLGRYAAELGEPALDRYFKFAIVRNPWDRMFSDYNYQLKKSRARESKLALYDGDRRRGFREWVRAVLGDPHRYPPETWGGEVSPGIHRWSPQVDWISLGGRVAVDHLAHLETLERDFARVWRKAGLPARPLPHRNRRRHFHYSFYYDAETRRRVAEYYARDIDLFGYRFDGLAAGLRRWFGGSPGTGRQPATGVGSGRAGDDSPRPERPAPSDR